jgi:RNA polymerase sigma-70 factor, ECF subfamily
MVRGTAPDPSEVELHLLVLRCQAGDERAFVRLHDSFGPRTLRYLRGIVGAAADDVQQEVWLAVYRGIARLARPGAFRTWLFRTARHRAVDHLRKSKREGELLVDAPEAFAVAASPPPAEESAGLSEAMLEALDALSTGHREVLLLRYRDGLRYEEIALVTGCAVGTVRSRIHYAKQHLRAAVAGREG